MLMRNKNYKKNSISITNSEINNTPIIHESLAAVRKVELYYHISPQSAYRNWITVSKEQATMTV